MRLDTPWARKDGDYDVRVYRCQYGDVEAEIRLDEKAELRLARVSLDDCDRLIRAAAAAREQILAVLAETAAPHGGAYLYQGTCQFCGKPEADELHGEPVITDSERTCLENNPESGLWCYRNGDHGVHRDADGEEWRTDSPDPLGPVGRLVILATDDSSCPVVGRVVGQVDEDTLEVLWGERQFEDNPGTGSYEPFDSLSPAPKAAGQ